MMGGACLSGVKYQELPFDLFFQGKEAWWKRKSLLFI